MQAHAIALEQLVASLCPPLHSQTTLSLSGWTWWVSSLITCRYCVLFRQLTSYQLNYSGSSIRFLCSHSRNRVEMSLLPFYPSRLGSGSYYIEFLQKTFDGSVVTAIKASGIVLWCAMRSLLCFVLNPMHVPMAIGFMNIISLGYIIHLRWEYWNRMQERALQLHHWFCQMQLNCFTRHECLFVSCWDLNGSLGSPPLAPCNLVPPKALYLSV
jgi:hypothetical protein